MTTRNGQVDHVTISVRDLPRARQFYAAALAAGGRSLSEPRERPEFGTGYYSTYVVDPEGNGLEALHRL